MSAIATTPDEISSTGDWQRSVSSSLAVLRRIAEAKEWRQSHAGIEVGCYGKLRTVEIRLPRSTATSPTPTPLTLEREGDTSDPLIPLGTEGGWPTNGVLSLALEAGKWTLRTGTIRTTIIIESAEKATPCTVDLSSSSIAAETRCDPATTPDKPQHPDTPDKPHNPDNPDNPVKPEMSRRAFSVEGGFEFSPPIGGKVGGAGVLGAGVTGALGDSWFAGFRAHARFVPAEKGARGGGVPSVEVGRYLGDTFALAASLGMPIWYDGNAEKGFVGARFALRATAMFSPSVGLWANVGVDRYSEQIRYAPWLGSAMVGVAWLP